MGQRSQEYHNNMVFFDKKIFEEDFFVNQQLQVSCSRARLALMTLTYKLYGKKRNVCFLTDRVPAIVMCTIELEKLTNIFVVINVKIKTKRLHCLPV